MEFTNTKDAYDYLVEKKHFSKRSVEKAFNKVLTSLEFSYRLFMTQDHPNPEFVLNRSQRYLLLRIICQNPHRSLAVFLDKDRLIIDAYERRLLFDSIVGVSASDGELIHDLIKNSTSLTHRELIVVVYVIVTSNYTHLAEHLVKNYSLPNVLKQMIEQNIIINNLTQ